MNEEKGMRSPSTKMKSANRTNECDEEIIPRTTKIFIWTLFGLAGFAIGWAIKVSGVWAL